MPQWALTLIISILGIITTYISASVTIKVAIAKLEQRLDNLEKKQDKHNNLIERMYKVEQKVEDFMLSK